MKNNKRSPQLLTWSAEIRAWVAELRACSAEVRAWQMQFPWVTTLFFAAAHHAVALVSCAGTTVAI